MTSIDLEVARRHQRALKHFFVSRTGTHADLCALRRVLVLHEAAGAALDDDYARDQLRLVADYAAELLCESDHAKWGRDSAAGAQFLREQVLNALDLLEIRLYSLEQLRARRA